MGKINIKLILGFVSVVGFSVSAASLDKIIYNFNEKSFMKDDRKIYKEICHQNTNPLNGNSLAKGQWDSICVANTWKQQKQLVNYIDQKGYIQLQMSVKMKIALVILEAANIYDVSKKLMLSMAMVESSLNIEAKSHVGALGLFQIMPATGKGLWKEFQRSLAMNHDLKKIRYTRKSLKDFRASALFSAFYYKKLLKRFNGKKVLALASYNAGPTLVERSTVFKSDKIANNTYNVAKDYYQKIMKYEESFKN